MRKIVLFVVAVGLLLFAFAGVALAASPQDIYNDYAADNKLDGTYTNAELQAYLSDAAIHQYGNAAVVDALDEVVQDILSGEDRDEFPFTGFQLLLFGVVAACLVAGGLGLRRLSRKA